MKPERTCLKILRKVEHSHGSPYPANMELFERTQRQKSVKIACQRTLVSYRVILGLSMKLLFKKSSGMDRKRYAFRSSCITKFSVDVCKRFPNSFGESLEPQVAKYFEVYLYLREGPPLQAHLPGLSPFNVRFVLHCFRINVDFEHQKSLFKQ